ncbi:MAG: M12 family metallo-peptidase, partial [bacterium]
MLSRSLAILATAAVLSAPAFSQARQPFPFTVSATDTALGTVTLAPEGAAIAGLTAESHVLLTDIYLPGGELIDVELYRLSVERRRFGFQVDGAAVGDLTVGLDLSIWRGTVPGEVASQVYLSFSNSGCRGWIQRANDVIHLCPQPNASGDWQNSEAVFVAESTLGRMGMTLGGFCKYDVANGMRGESQVPTQHPGGPGTIAAGVCATRECTVAVETDFQLFQQFADLNALTAYVTTLLTYASDRYETQIDTVLTYPYLQFYTNSGDPWASPEGGGSSIDMLNEFQGAWAGSIPTSAVLAHFLSGAGLGGGVAWLDVLCNNQFNFAVSGNINGQVSFPIQQQPNNWDFIVFTHEIGHNFGTPHTHDFCPPLDECAPSGFFGSCQSQQTCTSSGTIMSYCHLCSGGTANVTTFFHPSAAAVMQNGAANCLPLYSGVAVDPPIVLSSSATTPVIAQIAGTPSGTVNLWYRYQGGSYTSVPMTSLGGNQYQGNLPAAGCGDSPEFYVAFTDASCGPITSPSGAPGNVYTATVGNQQFALNDNFESATGWSSSNLGASTGDWERGVPVDDGGWAYDPASDHDGSGSCYLTMNQVGNTDVDGGAVRLLSPSLDLSGGPALITYAYYLLLTNEDGVDRLLVEISTNGNAGPWTQVVAHTSDGGTAWRNHAITADELALLGVAASADTRLRFTANDDGVQSIVEAGLDAFEASTLSCNGGGGPTAYCNPPGGNSVSAAGLTLSHISGSPGGVLTLQVDNAPL